MAPQGRLSFPPAPAVQLHAALTLIVIGFACLLTTALSVACLLLPLWLMRAFLNSRIPWAGPPGMLRVFLSVLLLFLVLGGFESCIASLWLLRPRRSAFHVPGPLLHPGDHPRLFAEIGNVAASFGIPVPDRVYLSADMAISVTEPNGLLTFTKSHVLTIGFPTLQVLTVAELRAMIAIGMAHLDTGDTALNPIIHSALAAMARVLHLSTPAAPLGPLRRVMTFYGMPIRRALARCISVYWKPLLLLCYNLALSLERRADALACYVAGTHAFVSGLRSSYRYWLAPKPFWDIEIAPLVNAGFLPPIAQGFGFFIQTPQIDSASARFLDTEMNRIERTAADPRPLLRDRIAAVPSHRVAGEESTAPAMELLDDLEETERGLVAHLFPHKQAGSLRQVAWDDLGKQVYGPAWRAFVRDHVELLSGMTPQSLPSVIRELSALSARMPNPPGMLFDPAQRLARCRGLLVFALSLLLMEHSWELTARGGQISFSRDGTQVNPSQELGALESGSTPPDAWVDRWRSLGLADVALAGTEVPAPRSDQA